MAILPLAPCRVRRRTLNGSIAIAAPPAPLLLSQPTCSDCLSPQRELGDRGRGFRRGSYLAILPFGRPRLTWHGSNGSIAIVPRRNPRPRSRLGGIPARDHASEESPPTITPRRNPRPRSRLGGIPICR